jgi:glycosyltransferase involved in cell wall biosynthesis
VYVGVMGVQDGVDQLLHALRQLADQRGGADFRCLLVGDGDARPALEALAAGLGLGPAVEFTGWLDRREIPEVLSAADICVDPCPANAYTDRSTAIKLMEYMAAARPSVVFDLTEHRVTAGDAAWYARCGEPGDLARQLSRLIDDPDARRSMGAIGRARVDSQLAWPFQARRLLAAYDHLLVS